MPGSNEQPAADEDDVEYGWHVVDGMIESVDRRDAAEGEKEQTTKHREAVVQYLRPLCDGEEISLEFYHEPGKFSLSPALGRIAILLSDATAALHWITADATGNWMGVGQENRVIDPNAKQLRPIELKSNDWNHLKLRLDGDLVVLSLNGENVYQRRWEAEVGRKFGLFHDPTAYHVRARNIQLTGNWPEQLPDDLFQTTPAENVASK
jgi:hypothetical protein